MWFLYVTFIDTFDRFFWMSIFFLLRFYKDPFDNSTVLVLMGLSCLNIRSIIHVKEEVCNTIQL